MTRDGKPDDVAAAERPPSAADALRRGPARSAGAEAATEPAPPPPAAPAATEPQPVTAAYDDVDDGPAAAAPSDTRRLVIPLLTVVAILLALAVTVTTLRVSNERAVAQARTDALAEAKKAVTAILSASYRTVDADIAAARKHLTPRFQKDYDKITKGSYRQLVVDNQSITTAEVQSGGVKQASRDRVVVLLFVNQLSTNNKRAVPRLDQPRVRMTLVLRDGKWLVDRMNAV